MRRTLANLLRRIWNRITWQRIPVEEFSIKEPGREARIALLYSVFFVFAAVGTGLLIRSRPIPLLGSASFTYDFWYAFLFKIVLLLVVPLYWFYRQGYTFRHMLPRWELSWKSVLIMVIAYIAGLSLNLLQGRFDLVLEGAGNFRPAGAALRIGVGIVMPLFIAGFPEEFVFRGFLQTRLERVSGRLIAISATAVLFTAWHLPTRYLLAQGVEGTAGDFLSVVTGTGIPVLIVGLIFGLLWDRYRTILPLIAAHWGVDILPAIISFLGIDY